MAVVTIDGIEITLPDGPTPVRVLEPVFIRTWPKWQARRGLSHNRIEARVLWPELLFALWGRNLIVLIARSGEPDAEPTPLDFPSGERVWSRWFTGKLTPYGELRHDPTRRRFFEVLVAPRLQVDASQVEPVTEPLIREEAIQQIIAEDKAPGTKNYTWGAFETEVRGLCRVGDDARGFSRRTLSRIYNDLKNQAK